MQSQKTAIGSSPFDQIAALEQSEKQRMETEFAGMQSEKEEVSASVQKKEEQATEEMRQKAKQELKTYSENDLSEILSSTGKDAEKECAAIEEKAKSSEKVVLEKLMTLAKKPETYFPSAA